MGYLVAAILLNVLISSLFKLFPVYRINAFQAVVVNYLVCVVTGCIFIGHIPVSAGTLHAPWLGWSVVMGVMFIAIFTLLAVSIRADGITTTTIANKLSLVIPAVFSVVLYKEQVGMGKIAGILLALPAIFLSTRVQGEGAKPQNLWLPVLVFAGGGLLDTCLKYVQVTYLTLPADQAPYAIFCFAGAGGIGLVIITVLVLLRKAVVHVPSLVAGAIIGIPNYFSIYYIIRMLNSGLMQSSAVIPVFNISVVVVSSVTAIVVFREQVNRWRIFGLLLSVCAILLIAFGDK